MAKEIAGDTKRYNFLDVCNMLEVNEGTIREWCSFFKDLIKPKTHKMVRYFNEDDIKKLAFIKSLIKDKKMSLAESKNYCINNGFNSDNTEIVILNNKEFMQEFTKIILSKMNNQFFQLQQSLDNNTEAINNLIAKNDINNDTLINISEGRNNELRSDIKLYIDNSNNKCEELAADYINSYDDLKSQIAETKDICNNVIEEVRTLSRRERRKQNSLFYKLFHKD